MTRAARILRGSLRGLSRNRLRTFFMMLGTLVGVCALTVILAIGRGTQQEMMRRVNQMLGGSSILLRAGGSTIPGGPHGAPASTLKLEDLRAIQDEVPDVLLADPLQMAGAKEVVYQGRSARIRIEGHSEAAEVVWSRSVQRGAYISAGDVASSARVALVGEAVVRELFEGRNPIGEQIRVGTVPLQVIGVLERVGIDPHGLDKDNEIISPVTTLMRRLRNVDYIAGAKFSLKEGTDLVQARGALGAVLRRRHALGPDQPDDFAMFIPAQVQQSVRSSNRVFTVFLPLASALTILIGGLVVANLMLMSVHDRRAEIGLRKAVGARARDIRLQFLAESAAVTGAGGLLAIALGAGLLQILALWLDTPAALPWGTALLGVGSALIVGVAAGVAPARRAARLDPVQTLR